MVVLVTPTGVPPPGGVKSAILALLMIETLVCEALARRGKIPPDAAPDSTDHLWLTRQQ